MEGLEEEDDLEAGLELEEFETKESVRVKGTRSCSEIGGVAILDDVLESDNS